MMRLLIVGSDKIHAIENFFVKYMKDAQVQVNLFPATSIFYDYYYNGLFNKLKYRAGISGILKTINQQFKEMVVQLNPDCIWVFKGMELFPATLEWVKTKGIKLANYNPDNPFVFTGRGSGNKNITRSLYLYDLHFTYSLEIEKELKKMFDARVVLLPFAYDIPDTVYDAALHQQEVIKTCFLGNPDKQRAGFIQQLAEQGVKIDLYGNDWNKFVKNDGITVFPALYETELWKVLARYRVQLNIMRVHNENAHNMRSFEVPAIGGIMLAPDTPDHRFFFEMDQEIFLYTGITQCVEKINYLLQLSEQDADLIRKNARDRCTRSGYSYKDRAMQVIREINDLNA